MHGSAELELSGCYEDGERAERQFALVLDAIGAGLRTVGGETASGQQQA